MNETNVLDIARKYMAGFRPAIEHQKGHKTTLLAARALIHGFDLQKSDALTLLKEWNTKCRPPWTETELIHKINSVDPSRIAEPKGYLLTRKYEYNHNKSQDKLATPIKTIKNEFEPEILKKVATRIPNTKASFTEDIIQFLKGKSPIKTEKKNGSKKTPQDSIFVLNKLYPPESNEKVIIFSDMRSQGQFIWEANTGITIKNETLPTGPNGIWFLPQPVTGEYIPNPRLEGKLSRRSEEAVTAWRYVVIESDEADTDQWLRCLIQMPLKIVCICESGGKSIHALVKIDAKSKEEWNNTVNQWKTTLITLGACPGSLSAVRLSRLPQAMRNNKLQRLLYLNPQANGTPIASQIKFTELKQILP